MTAGTPTLRAPEALAASLDVSRFNNGAHLSLDQWLRERAHASEGLSARTYVVALPPKLWRAKSFTRGQFINNHC